MDTKETNQILRKTLNKLLFAFQKIFDENPAISIEQFGNLASDDFLEHLTVKSSNAVAELSKSSEIDIDELIFHSSITDLCDNFSEITSAIQSSMFVQVMGEKKPNDEQLCGVIEKSSTVLMLRKITEVYGDLNDLIDRCNEDDKKDLLNLYEVLQRLPIENLKQTIAALPEFLQILDDAQMNFYEKFFDNPDNDYDVEMTKIYGDYAYILGSNWVELLSTIALVCEFEDVLTKKYGYDIKISFKECNKIDEIVNEMISSGNYDSSYYANFLDN